MSSINDMNFQRPTKDSCRTYATKVLQEHETFIHILHKWKDERPHHIALVWYEGGRVIAKLTYIELWEAIDVYAAEIEKILQPGECAILLFEFGLQFIIHFYACLRVSVIAVPCYPPMPGNEQRGIEVLSKVLKNSEATCVMMSKKIAFLKRFRGKWPTSVNGMNINYVTVKKASFVTRMLLGEKSATSTPSSPYSQNSAFISPPASPLSSPGTPMNSSFYLFNGTKYDITLRSMPSREDIAFLQYTSGSTGDPKGVCIGHDAFFKNLVYSSYWLVVDTNDASKLLTDNEDCISTSWLPMHHDMGLCLGISNTLYVGGTAHLMPPFDFLKDPLLWLDIVSWTKSTYTVAPNFAYGLVCKKWDAKRAVKWDFSSVRMFGNSAEPIMRSTIEEFTALMSKSVSTFRMELLTVGYGMAENVATIGTSAHLEKPIYSHTTPHHVASIPYVNERIDTILVISLENEREDEQHPSHYRVCKECEVGEIWLQTPSMSTGYWRQPELTFKTFRNKLNGYEGYWMRSGDLGYIEDGHLFVAGRCKDVIIINGRNYYPQDIEFTVQRDTTGIVRKGCIAAFAVTVYNSEGFCVVAEIEEKYHKVHQAQEMMEVILKIQSSIRNSIHRAANQVILIHPRTIPKTTSGKIRRSETKKRWEENSLQEIMRFPKEINFQKPTSPVASSPTFSSSMAVPPTAPPPSPLPEFMKETPLQPPLTEMEKTLAEIWSLILEIPYAWVGLDSNFISLGGHSLSLMNLLAKVESTWDILIPVASFFAASTLIEMVQTIDEALKEKEILKYISSETRSTFVLPPLTPYTDRPEKIPLSFSQQRMWFIELMNPQKALYQVPVLISLYGKYDVDALQQAYRAMIIRHESLRTRFLENDGIPYQIIDAADKATELVIIQLSIPVEDYVSERIQEPFSLFTGPLIRGELLKINEEEAVLFINMHHIITDGYSVRLYIKEFAKFYEWYVLTPETSTSNTSISEVFTPVLQFADYSNWQQSWLHPDGDIFLKQLSYWKEELQNIPPTFNLPIMDYPRPEDASFRGNVFLFDFSDELVKRLEIFAKRQGLTMYMVMLSALQILLHRYTGEKIIPIGCPVANRRVEETEEIFGLFVNTVVMKGEFEGKSINPEANSGKDILLKSFVHETKQKVFRAMEYQDIPFDHLVATLKPTRDKNINPLFQIMLAYEDVSKDELMIGDLKMIEWEGIVEGKDEKRKQIQNSISKFDLTFTIKHDRENAMMRCELEYALDLFEMKTIQRLSEHFLNLLEDMCRYEDGNISIYSLLYLTDEEVNQQLTQWNQISSNYPDILMHHLFEEQASLVPEAIALVFRNQEVTYRELNSRANQLAHFLRGQGVGTEDGKKLVGLGTDRSIEMIVGIIAILKAGGAYVPLDLSYPDDRLAFVIEDACVSHLITQQRQHSRWDDILKSRSQLAMHVNVVDIDINYSDNYPDTNPTWSIIPTNLAYIIYTSGTTGKPKGVMIMHRSLSVFLQGMLKCFPLQPSDTVLQRSSISFDMSVIDIVYPLICGAKGVLCDENQQRDILSLLKLIAVYQVTFFIMTPSLLHLLLLQQNEEKPEMLTTKRVIVGGEAIEVSLISLFYQKLPQSLLYNGYGPTEATVIVTTDLLNPQSSIVTIGKAFTNANFYVLDSSRSLLPIGCYGELYIGGNCVAAGYLNRPELSNERFIWHNFKEVSSKQANIEDTLKTEYPSERLYKTGDIVKLLPDGNLVYIGRVDNQVKIRGYRIEIEEVETSIMDLEGVENVAVIVKGDGEQKVLVAFIVKSLVITTSTGSNIHFLKSIREQLTSQLPQYMIPTFLQVIDEMPLNVNGKVDRKALSALTVTLTERIASTAVAEDSVSEDIMNDEAKAIANIWALILKLPLEKIGSDTNFFSCGGNSLSFMQLVHQLQSKMGIHLNLSSFYKMPTIRTILENMKTQELQHDINRIIEEDVIELSFESSLAPALFLIHEMSGFVSQYKSLATSLGSKYTIYGINFPAIRAPEYAKSYSSIENIASNYVQKIKKMVPNGPYHLGGWSMGGNIALEMTRQLQEQGEVVDTLLLLDTHYQVFQDELEESFMDMIIQELFTTTFSIQDMPKDSNSLKQMMKMSAQLMRCYQDCQAKKTIHVVKNVLFLKCHESIASQVNQALDYLQGCNHTNIFNGMNNYFLPNQSIHMLDIESTHFQLFHANYEELLHAKIVGLFTAIESGLHRYELGNDLHNLQVILNSGSSFLIRQMIAEFGWRYPDKLPPSQENTSCLVRWRTLFPPAVPSPRNTFQHEPHPRNTVVHSSAVSIDTHSLDVGRFVEENGLPTTSHSLLDVVDHLDSYLNLRKEHYYTYQQGRAIQDTLHAYIRPLIMIQQLSCTFWILSTPFLCIQMLSLVQRLLTLRILSLSSINTLAAYILDDVFYSMFLSIASQPCTFLPYYTFIALARDQAKEVGLVFNAIWLLSLVLVSPVVLYAAITTPLGLLFHIESNLIQQWQMLSSTHLLAVIPDVTNSILESWYHSTYHRSYVVLGTLVECAATLIVLVIIQESRALNGASLGIAISIGSFCKMLVYAYHLLVQKTFQSYHFFHIFPLQIHWQWMNRVRKESVQRISITLCSLSNYLLIAILIAASTNAMGLAIYRIGKSVFDIITLPVNILRPLSITVMQRLYTQDFTTLTFVTSWICFGFTCFFLLPFLITLSCLSGKELTQLFYSLEMIPSYALSDFYDTTYQTTIHFIILGISQSYAQLISSWLQMIFAYRVLYRWNIVISLILGNLGVLLLYYLAHDAKERNTHYIIIVWCCQSLLVLVYLYEWIRSYAFTLFLASSAAAVPSASSAPSSPAYSYSHSYSPHPPSTASVTATVTTITVA